MELGLLLRESLMAPQLWREQFTHPNIGRSYTMFYPQLRGKDYFNDAIFLHVNTSDGLTRRVFIHDPEFFVPNLNALGMPIKPLILTPHNGSVYFSLALREHIKLNTPQSPCLKDPGYSFTTCVRESNARNVGCRQRSDTLSDQSWQICDTLEQYKAMSADFWEILDAPMEEIIKKTSCQTPCRYKEYAVLDGPLESSDTKYSYFSVDFWFSSTDTTVLTEIPVYPWTSLLAEFGGTFSLFFGLSMMTLWDGLEKLSGVVKTVKKRIQRNEE